MKFTRKMSDFVSKPFQPEELQSVIGKYVLAGESPSARRNAYVNMDLYSQGDPEFKRELAGLMINSIQELQAHLQLALETTNAEFFSKACHKVNTTLSMLGDNEFTSVIDGLRAQLNNGVFDESLLKTELNAFNALCIKVTEGLEEEIRSL